MTISKRLVNGWTEQQVNNQKYVCDDCGAKLWVAPDGKTIYCNETATEHKAKEL